LLLNVYIFREDGICLFTRTYGSIETDEAIVSGFLSAISSFGEQIGTASLKQLDFGNYRIILINTGENLITAGVIDKDDDVFVVETALKRLTYDFQGYYKNFKDGAVSNSLFEGYSENADEILQFISSPNKTIAQAKNLSRVIRQMKNKFAILLEVIASGKPLYVCAESREETEIYVHTLAKLHPIIELVPWTEDEKTIYSLKHRKNTIVGIPLTCVMKLAEDEELSILNLVQFRIHSKVQPTKKWKDVAKYAVKNADEMGDESTYSYIQSRMPKNIIDDSTNLKHAIKQMSKEFPIILEVIASGKPLVVSSESREETELYANTLAKFRSQIDCIPWTEDEELIFSLKERSNTIVGVPLTYVMKLAEDEEHSILNLAQFRIHGNVKASKNWKEVAKYVSKKLEELGDDGIYTYVQSRMED